MSGVAVQRRRIRLKCDAQNHTLMLCQLTGKTPKLWRGIDAQIEVGLFDGGIFCSDLSNLASLILEIHASPLSGAPIVQKTLVLGDLTDDLVESDWTGKDPEDYHGLFEFTGLETNLEMTGATENSRTFWLVVHAVTTDGYYVTFGLAQLVVQEDGAQNGLAVVGTNQNWRVSPTTGLIQFYNATTEKWHSFVPTGPAGAVVGTFEQDGED
jgi:hypothetical protein